MSTIFFTADPHIGHPRVAERRGFSSVEEHDQWYVDMWQKHIGNRDHVYILGDIAVHHPEQALEVLATLPGTKHLVAGNHDPVHPMYASGYNRWYRKFSEVFETIAQTRTVKVGGYPVILSHFPYQSWGDGEGRPGSRYNEWRMPSSARPLLHGHTHGTERAHWLHTETHTESMLHVGIDAWGQPVPESWVAEWLDPVAQKNPPAWLSPSRYGKQGLVCKECYQSKSLAELRPRGRFFRCRDGHPLP